MTSFKPARRALIVVDVQPTFCEGGALAVAGGNAIAEKIASYAKANRQHYEYVVTTQDWHVDPGEHFSLTPDFVDTWPPHGVAGTTEAELHPALAELEADAAVRKGEFAAAYSGFEGKDESGAGLHELLTQARVTAVDVVGLAESHCVLETALDAHQLGYTTRVLSDLTVPVSPEQGERAHATMREAGIEQIDSTAN